MILENIKKQFRERDRSVKVLSKDGNFRAVAVKNKNTTLTAQNLHNLPLMPAYYLANAITSATLISSFLKGEERVIVDINSNALINKIYAEVMQVGECRGYINTTEENQTLSPKIQYGLC